MKSMGVDFFQYIVEKKKIKKKILWKIYIC